MVPAAAAGPAGDAPAGGTPAGGAHGGGGVGGGPGGSGPGGSGTRGAAPGHSSGTGGAAPSHSGAGSSPRGGRPPEDAAQGSRAPEGSAPEGSAPEGSAPEGSAPEGSAPEGSAPDGSAPERAFPVREISVRLRDYIARLSRVWIEGQVVEVSRRGGTQVYVTLRDVAVDASVTVVVPTALERGITPPLAAGQRVLLLASCEYWVRNGRLVLRASAVRPVGIGELLATLERRKQQLAAEGLFAPELKRRLPLLPGRIGLITGVNAQAQHDVVTHARTRWPAVEFETRQGPVQGAAAVPAVIEALTALDADPHIDVIVIARGGGSLEDLLAFSDESLVRAVAAARTPVVSAIGHEQDSPLLDLVADVRASTPSHAGKLVVPDWAEESRGIHERRKRIDRTVLTGLSQAQTWLDQTRSRPALSEPLGVLPRLTAEVQEARERLRRAIGEHISRPERDLAHLRARARSLSPLATLDRGYAVVVGPSGSFVREAQELEPGDGVRVRVAVGHFSAQVTDVASST